MTAEVDADADSLQADVLAALLAVRAQGHPLPLHAAPGAADLLALQAWSRAFARNLAPRIGGRYVPKRDARAARDAAVWAAFNGRNHQAVMKQFGISRRLLYSILSRRRR